MPLIQRRVDETLDKVDCSVATVTRKILDVLSSAEDVLSSVKKVSDGGVDISLRIGDRDIPLWLIVEPKEERDE